MSDFRRVLKTAASVWVMGPMTPAPNADHAGRQVYLLQIGAACAIEGLKGVAHYHVEQGLLLGHVVPFVAIELDDEPYSALSAVPGIRRIVEFGHLRVVGCRACEYLVADLYQFRLLSVVIKTFAGPYVL